MGKRIDAIVQGWLKPIVDRLDILEADGRKREVCNASARQGMETKIIGAIPDYRDELTVISAALNMLATDVHSAPRLSVEMLQAWDAISYSVEKFDKDKPEIPREPEVMQWAILYLSENHWNVPPEDVMRWLLGMRDAINAKRLVGRFD